MNKRVGAAVVLTWLLTAISAFPAINAAALDTAFQQLPRIDFSEDAALLAPINEAAAAARFDELLRRDLEQRLIAVLQGEATTAAKDYACWALRLAGSRASLPVLIALVPNEELSSAACRTLECLPGGQVDQALRDALPTLTGQAKRNVVQTLGERRDGASIKTLRDLLSDRDAGVAGEAAMALSKMGTADAATILASFRPRCAAVLRAPVTQAYLETAQRLADQGERELPTKIYRELLRESQPGELRLACFRGLVQLRAPDAVDRLMGALNGPDASLRNLAGHLLIEWPGASLPSTFVSTLTTLPADGQVTLLEVIRIRSEPESRLSVLRLIESRNESARVAALETLATVGTSADVKTLAQAAVGHDAASQTALKSLVMLQDVTVNPVIVASLSWAKPPVRVQMLRALALRTAVETAPDVLQYTDAKDDETAQAALAALAVIGGKAHISPLITRLGSVNSSAPREAIVDAIIGIVPRLTEQEVAPIFKAMKSSAISTRISLLRVLVSMGSPSAQSAVAEAAKDEDLQLKEAATKALTQWPGKDAGQIMPQNSN